MSEKTDFNLLRKHMVQHGDRVDRIENIVGFGTPDVNFCIEGVEGWIEIKSPEEPKRASSKLFAGKHKLNQDQKNWFLKQKNAKGRGYVLICTDKRWMLIDGCKYGDQINDMTVEELYGISIWAATKPIIKKGWIVLRKMLGETL